MATISRASELKQQGALEAAQDPNSGVSAQAAEKKMLEEARKGGSAAYEFDPNASPEEKAAQAKAVRGIAMPAVIAVLTLNSKSQRASTTSENRMPRPLSRML